ncbi:transglycosylase domain-containing protein [Streptomyces sp. L7]
MAEGGSVQSGSTITQQFVKNTYLDQSQTVSRKFRELLISTKIGAAMSKEQILQGYLNTCFFGRQANGIQAAAHMYYNLRWRSSTSAREPSSPQRSTSRASSSTRIQIPRPGHRRKHAGPGCSTGW